MARLPAMARSRRSPARLVVALSVAAVLAVFLIYTAIAGSTPALEPSNLSGHLGIVSLTGKVTGRVSGDAHSAVGLHFALHDINGKSPLVPIVYHGSVPDLFESGRDVNVTGELHGTSFVATALTTKCPSKYTAKV
jgi:cytochrome c-type biogenesis protein CcmE